MSAAVQTFASTAYGSRTNTTVTKPTSTASGDLLLAFVSRGVSGSAPTMPTPPAGWTLWWQAQDVVDASTFHVGSWAFKRDAGGSEPANYTWTHNTTGSVEISIVRINGHNVSSPITVITENKGTGVTSTAIGLTTPENSALVCLFSQDWAFSANSLTAPTGSTPTFTKLFSAATTTLQAFFYGSLASAGATSNKTFTNNSDASSPWLTCMFVVNSAAYAPADFVDRANMGINASAAANQASLAVTLSGTTPYTLGDLAVIAIANDNRLTAVSGDDNTEVTSVVDSTAGNTWTKGKGSSFGTSAQAGAACFLFYSKLAVPIPIGGTITATFNGTTTNDATAATVHKFEVAPGKTVAVEATASEGANTANPPASLNATTSNISCLRVRATAIENGTTSAVLTPTASWTAWTGTQIGTTAAGQTIRAEHILSTATSAASDPTIGATALNEASVYVAFRADSSVVPQIGKIIRVNQSIIRASYW